MIDILIDVIWVLILISVIIILIGFILVLLGLGIDTFYDFREDMRRKKALRK